MASTLQVALMRFGAGRELLADSLLLLSCQAHAQLLGNGPGNLLLQDQDVRNVSVVLFAPKLGTVLDVNELGLDDQAVATLKELAREHGSNLEFPSDLLGIDLATLVSERGAARHHAQPSKLRHQVAYTPGHPVAD